MVDGPETSSTHSKDQVTGPLAIVSTILFPSPSMGRGNGSRHSSVLFDKNRAKRRLSGPKDESTDLD